MRKIYITEEADYPVSEATLALANATGAEQIYSGVPLALVDEIGAETRGYIELPDPEPVVQDDVPETITVPVSALTDLRNAMTNPSINSIAEIKSAIKDFTDSMV